MVVQTQIVPEASLMQGVTKVQNVVLPTSTPIVYTSSSPHIVTNTGTILTTGK